MWILQSADATFRLKSGAIKTVGRAPRADFILDVALVSRLHCRLTAGDEKLEVVDLKSTNGTFVNDKRVEKAKLATGDRLRIGRVELTVEEKEHGSWHRSMDHQCNQPSAMTRNGFVRLSFPIVVSGPCPECTMASSPSGNSTLRIEAISVS